MHCLLGGIDIAKPYVYISGFQNLSMPPGIKTKKEVIKISGRHNELITVTDDKGNIIKRVVRPLMVKFYLRDLMQVMVGASVLAIPVAFTEETWLLGETLPLSNILGLITLSLLFIGGFVYYNYYRGRLREHGMEYAKRVLLTYTLSFMVVTLILILIERAPWATDSALAFSRTAIVSFPASMSASIADVIK